jgi:hypothetical protein
MKSAHRKAAQFRNKFLAGVALISETLPGAWERG